METVQTCLANNMRRYRKLKRLSQEKLAEKAGASTNYIALIENGKYFPSLPMICQIASALEIDSIDLFDKAALDYPDLENLKAELLESIAQAVNTTFNKNI